MKKMERSPSLKLLLGMLAVLLVWSCNQVEEFEPQLADNDQLSKVYNFTGPLVEPVNWAMRGKPDGTPGQGGGNGGNNGGNVECSEVGEFEFSSGRNNYKDFEFDSPWPEGLEVEVVDGTFVNWTFTAPEGYCLANMAVIVKGGPAANVYDYASGITSDQGLKAPVNASGKPAALSNLTFCWNLVEEPEPPVSVGDEEECYGEAQGQFLSLTAKATVPEGVDIVWYDAPTGGNKVSDPTLTDIGEKTFWAEAVRFEGCVSSERTPVTLKLNDCRDGGGNGGGDWCKDGGDTAFAGPVDGLLRNQGWFYLMDYNGEEVSYTLWAGQTNNAGQVTLTPDGDNVKVRVSLAAGVQLQTGEDNWFVHGYTTAPSSRPQGGQQGTAVTYKKGEASSAPFEFSLLREGATIFAVHVNVIKPCPLE